uniref:Uncharacterized protein n=1 Tax=Rhizophora mucronata TaxID=61149 RepID=A0A2P2Q443_RHIMU
MIILLRHCEERVLKAFQTLGSGSQGYRSNSFDEYKFKTVGSPVHSATCKTGSSIVCICRVIISTDSLH